MQKEIYTSGEVAKLLDIPNRTISHYLKTGVIPATQHPVTGSWKISSKDLITFMEQHGLDASELQSHLKILIADDDVDILSLMEKGITQIIRNSKIKVTTNGYDAMVEVASDIPDILILDVQMPEMDGRQVLQAIKRGDKTKDVKILAISGSTEAIEDMKTLGANAVLLKPFKIPELINAMELLSPKVKNQTK